jgi:hypothetical protein
MRASIDGGSQSIDIAETLSANTYPLFQLALAAVLSDSGGLDGRSGALAMEVPEPAADGRPARHAGGDSRNHSEG